MIKFALNLMGVLIVRAGGAVIVLAMNSAVAHLYGLAQSGEFFIFLTVVLVVSVVSRLGFDYTIVKLASAYSPARAFPTFLRALASMLAVSSLVSLILLGLGSAIESALLVAYGVPANLVAIYVSALCHGILFLVASFLQGLGAPHLTTLVRTAFTPIVFLGILGVGHVLGYEHGGIIFTYYAAASVISACACLLLLVAKLSGRDVGFGMSSSFSRKEVYDSAFPLYVVALFELVIQWFTQIFSVSFLSSDEIAGFSFCLRIALATSMVLMSINLLVAPKFAKLFADGERKKLTETIRMSATASAVSGLGILAVFVVLSSQILRVVAPGLEAYSLILTTVILGKFLSACAGPVQQLLSMTGNERDVRNGMIVTVMMVVAATVFLVPSLGIVGGALSIVLGAASNAMVLSTLTYRRLGVVPFFLIFSRK